MANLTPCLFLIHSLRHECSQTVCDQRPQPLWNGSHREEGADLSEGRGH